jgi:hypothetical protein
MGFLPVGPIVGVIPRRCAPLEPSLGGSGRIGRVEHIGEDTLPVACSAGALQRASETRLAGSVVPVDDGQALRLEGDSIGMRQRVDARRLPDSRERHGESPPAVQRAVRLHRAGSPRGRPDRANPCGVEKNGRQVIDVGFGKRSTLKDSAGRVGNPVGLLIQPLGDVMQKSHRSPFLWTLYGPRTCRPKLIAQHSTTWLVAYLAHHDCQVKMSICIARLRLLSPDL